MRCSSIPRRGYCVFECFRENAIDTEKEEPGHPGRCYRKAEVPSRCSNLAVLVSLGPAPDCPLVVSYSAFTWKICNVYLRYSEAGGVCYVIPAPVATVTGGTPLLREAPVYSP